MILQIIVRILKQPNSNVAQVTIGIYLKTDDVLVMVRLVLIHRQLKIYHKIF